MRDSIHECMLKAKLALYREGVGGGMNIHLSYQGLKLEIFIRIQVDNSSIESSIHF